MKRLAIAFAIATLALTGAAMARDHDKDRREQEARDRNSPPSQDRRGEREHFIDRVGGRDPGPRNADPRDYGREVYGPPRVPEGRGPEAPWRRGEFLPPQQRGPVVSDYERYHLRRPPPGFYWSRSANGFVLMSRSTGQIFESVGDY